MRSLVYNTSPIQKWDGVEVKNQQAARLMWNQEFPEIWAAAHLLIANSYKFKLHAIASDRRHPVVGKLSLVIKVTRERPKLRTY